MGAEKKLIGRSLMECHNQASRERYSKWLIGFIEDNNHNIVYTFHNENKIRMYIWLLFEMKES